MLVWCVICSNFQNLEVKAQS